ncbi:MAG: DUF6515 family protein [Myxococcota bacterium]
MKNFILVVTMLGAGAAFAHGPGGFRGGGFHGARPAGWHEGGWRGPRPVYVAPRPVYVAPRPVYVAPRPIRPPMWVPGYGYRPHITVMPQVSFFPQLPVGAITVYVGSQPYFYGNGVFYVSSSQGYSVVQAPLGAVVAQLPPDATMQVINGYTYASTPGGTWFYWDGNQGAWVVTQSPY